MFYEFQAGEMTNGGEYYDAYMPEYEEDEIGLENEEEMMEEYQQWHEELIAEIQ